MNDSIMDRIMAEATSTGDVTDKQLYKIALNRAIKEAPLHYRLSYYAMQRLYKMGGRNIFKRQVFPTTFSVIHKLPGFDFLFDPYKNDPQFNVTNKMLDIMDFIFMYEEGK